MHYWPLPLGCSIHRPFRADYDVEITLEDPRSPLLSPRRIGFGGRGAVAAIHPATGVDWLADIGGPPVRCFTCPNPRWFAALADGGGVLLSCDWEPEFRNLDGTGVLADCDAVAAVDSGVLVLHDGWDQVLALGYDGVMWEARVADADGIRLHYAGCGLVVGELNHPHGGDDVPFALDLATGARQL